MSKKILIIEDDVFVRELYQNELQKEGFEVEGAGDGPEGLFKAARDSYDLILLDIMLPKMNGIDLLRTLKSRTETKALPVILLTNLGQDAVVKEGFRLGAEGYLIKSAYTPSQVVGEVKKFFNKEE